MSFNLSGAFNTIQARLQKETLEDIQVERTGMIPQRAAIRTKGLHWFPFADKPPIFQHLQEDVFQSVIVGTVFHAAVCWDEGNQGSNPNRLKTTCEKSLVCNPSWPHWRRRRRTECWQNPLIIKDDTSRPLTQNDGRAKATDLLCKGAMEGISHVKCHWTAYCKSRALALKAVVIFYPGINEVN